MYKDKIERISLKTVNLSCHLSFKETCLNNSLLPTYTNIYMYILSLYLS